MSKKDLASVTTDLSALANLMPTQRPTQPSTTEMPALKVVARPKPKKEDEPVTQFSLSLRASLRKDLSRLASDADMTMRAFVLLALKEKGLKVHDEDLADLRKR